MGDFFVHARDRWHFAVLFGLFLVTRAVFMSSGSQMRAMLALTGAGAAFFVVGWLLARNDPEGRS